MYLCGLIPSTKGIQTRELQVSRDVVFDELRSWYSDANDAIGADVKDDVVVQIDKPQSQDLSGP